MGNSIYILYNDTNMLKYVDVKEVFAEVPDEVSLAISISGCPLRCKSCHSKYLWEDKGEYLTTLKLKEIIDKHRGITCVCFMGGDSQPEEINYLAWVVKHNHPELKVAWYSGMDALSREIDLANFDFIKLGKYEEEKGPLTSNTTNQRMLARLNKMDANANQFYDITYKFWKNNDKV